MKPIVLAAGAAIAAGVALVAGVAVAGRSTRAPSQPAIGQSPVRVEEIGTSDIIQVAQPEQFGLALAATVQVNDALHLTGVVAPDVDLTVPVNALASGRVVAIHAKLGDDVKAGQTLLVMHSPELASALSDYEKARADDVLAEQTLVRDRALWAADAIPRKDLEDATTAAQKAAIDLHTASDLVRVLGGSVTHPSPLLAIKAPISGTIIEQNVTNAAGVKSPDNAPNLFTIANFSRVWVLCDVYEDDLARVRVGALARVHLNAYPDSVFQGTVRNISKLLDPNTRTAKVRVELENRSGIMREGMFATVDLLSRDRYTRTVVPTTALLRQHDKDWVFVRDTGAAFRRLEVVAGPSVGDSLQQVLGGLKPGDRVVRDALQFSRVVEHD